MRAPIYFLALPAAVSLLLLVVHREQIRYLLFIAASLFFAISTFIIRIDPAGDTVFYEIVMNSEYFFLGRSFIISEDDISLVQIVYFYNAIWGMFAYFFRKYDRIIPLGLLFSAMLLSAYAVTPFLYAGLIISLAVILSIPLLVGHQNKLTNGITRYLLLQILALPFILLAGWFLAGGEITPVNPEQLVQAALLLGLGFILWLGVFPFHSWVPLLYREARTINLGYILQLLIFINFLIVLKFIDGFSWLRQYTIYFQALLLLGAIMEVLGALGILFQRNLKDINAYALLHLIGVMMTSLGVYLFSEGTVLAHTFLVFFVSFIFMHISLEYIDVKDKGFHISSLAAGDWYLPAMAGYVYGLLSLAGIPLTFGFAPTQRIYQVLANANQYYFWAIFISKLAIAITSMRFIKRIFHNTKDFCQLIPKKTNEWFFVFFLLIVIIAAIFQNFAYNWFGQLINGFGNLIQ